MRLALSTAAAVDFTLDELLAACRRRGLAGVELGAGHAHGAGPELAAFELETIRRRAETAGIRIVGYYAASRCEAFAPEAATLSAALGVPVIAPADRGAGVPTALAAGRSADDPPAEPGGAPAGVTHPDREGLAVVAQRYAEAGGTLLLSHRADPAGVNALCRVIAGAPAGAVGLAWEVDPADHTLASQIPAVLRAAGTYLRHVRLHGGGPEATQQSGRGIGPLMAHLALARYDGVVALTPTTSRYRVAWGAWLGRGGGWGCGSKTADPSLVSLDPSREVSAHDAHESRAPGLAPASAEVEHAKEMNR